MESATDVTILVSRPLLKRGPGFQLARRSDGKQPEGASRNGGQRCLEMLPLWIGTDPALLDSPFKYLIV